MNRALLLVILLIARSLSAAPALPPAHDPREMEAFIDGVMEAQKLSHHFAGAVVVVVRDGKIFFEKGYGYSDFAERRPVDHQKTLFRVASNTKMFVWTAVMQLAEEGKLDLHTDVNQYLKGLQIPAAYKQPITLEHLMTHTAGFEDHTIGLFAKSQDKMQPLAELLKNEMPNRFHSPGTITAYSNYGAALAGLIVEQVSGKPFETYLMERILQPLGMKNATIAQPVPAEMAVNLSKGYRWAGGRLQEQPFEYVPWSPAGGMSVSGEDMGRFMMAHLNDGELDGKRILRPETARAMRERLISFSPKINGMLHGFIEMNWNSQTIFGHGGDTLWMHSLAAMLPGQRMGVFIAYNADDAAAARDKFFDAFLDHYFPLPLAKEPSPPKDRRAKLERYVGTYSSLRISQSDLTKAFVKLFSAENIGVNADGYLVSNGGVRWRQVSPLVFHEVDGKRQLVFRENTRDEVTGACISPFCVVALEKQLRRNTTAFQLAWLGTCAVILLLALIAFPLVAIAQRGSVPFLSMIARLTAWLTSLMFVTGAAIFASSLWDNPVEIIFGLPPAVRTGMNFWTAATILAVCLILFTIVAWRKNWWRWPGRVSFTLVSIAGLGFAAWLKYWNLL